MITASLKPRQRLIWIEHGVVVGTFFKFKPLIRRYAQLANTPAVHSIICVSHATKDNIASSGVAKDKLTVVYNWTGQITCSERPNSDLCELVTTPRLVPLKGVGFLLKALLPLKDLSWHLTIVGEGESRADLETQAKQDLPGRVTFAGYSNDVPSFLCRSDIFVNPSIHPGEGLPISNVEALSAGLPVVSSSYGGAKETVIDGKTGFLVDPKDTTQFTEKLRLLLTNSVLRKTMSNAALEDYQQRFNAPTGLEATFRILIG
jgi:glycosyltransferase involved in cell wall biosynthesis